MTVKEKIPFCSDKWRRSFTPKSNDMNYSLLLKHKLQFAGIIRWKYSTSNSNCHVRVSKVVFQTNFRSRWFKYIEFQGLPFGGFENRLAVNTGSSMRNAGALTHLNIFTIQQCSRHV